MGIGLYTAKPEFAEEIKALKKAEHGGKSDCYASPKLDMDSFRLFSRFFAQCFRFL